MPRGEVRLGFTYSQYFITFHIGALNSQPRRELMQSFISLPLEKENKPPL